MRIIQHRLWKNIYQYRRYIWRNAWNELRYRYAGTGMGIFWNVIHPFVIITLYTAIFSWIFPQRARSGGYVIYLTSGLLAWRVFSETIQRGSDTFVENARYLKRLAIPSEIFVAKTVLTFTFLLCIYYLLLLPIAILLGNRPPDWSIVLLPVLLLCLQSLAFGMVLTLATLRALFPDIQEILHAFVPLWMWTIPVIYPENILPETLRPWLPLNPPYLFLQSIRHLILEQELPGGKEWFMMSGWLLFFLWVGLIVHWKFQTDIKDII